MRKMLSLLASGCLMISGTAGAQDDQTNYTFSDGSVMVYCAAPTKADQISSEIFLEAFPLWMTNLQEEANDGRVARAHYLNELKQGILYVVIGENKETAMANAKEIQAENQGIMLEAMSKESVDGSELLFEDTCVLIEVGPVAILPMN